jgi:dipeptidyl aminopeptidase/acylaminoacyl peptidase
MLRPFFVCVALGLTLSGPALADKRPMAVPDLFAFKRVADPQISPDGRQVAYQVGSVDLSANKATTNIWVAATDGKTPPRRLTASTKSDRHPRWSPDGTKVLFESNRSGENQLWVIDLTGGEARQLTTLSTGASSAIWSPDGTSVAFVSAVYPEFSDKPFAESEKLNKARLDEVEKGPVKARVVNKLFLRHWVEYVDNKRQHLFVVKSDGGEPRDVTPGDRDAYPTSTTFSGGEDFTFSPDSSHLVFTAVPERDEAWSTNYDLCRVSVLGGKIETLTKDNLAADGSPRFSPDGKLIAWRAQKRAGYEADKWVAYVAPCSPDGKRTGKPVAWTERLFWGGGRADGVVMQPALADISVDELEWVSNKALVVNVDEDGSHTVYHVGGPENGHRLESGRVMTGLSASHGNNPRLAFAISSLDAPSEVFVRSTEGDRTPINISHANDVLLASLDRSRPEFVQVDVEGGKMQMWILKPPGFDDTKKWPVAYLVHGGPQGVWSDSWSFRWNPQTWAAQGYVIVLPNPRGSTGFGQKFVDEISGDWGGKCYRDLMAGLDYVEKLPYVDKERIASAGGSFGGYMMNWFAVNESAKRFKCLITHCSVWNFESMWGTTDELWFDEWEHQGLPWEKPGSYAEFSPHKKAANLAKFKTPMLVIHNDLDFRCPIGQGHELFTALQRQKVPSRFVNFPDEGHWVLKPKNSEFWHKEVFGWLKTYCSPGPK